MKNIRLINGVFFLAIFILVTTLTCISWYNQGGNYCQLLAAALFYGFSCFGIWLTIDDAIRDSQNS